MKYNITCLCGEGLKKAHEMELVMTMEFSERNMDPFICPQIIYEVIKSTIPIITRKTKVHSVIAFISLPKDKILDWSKFKAFADEKFNIAKKMISLCDRVENTGKRRKCCLPAFSPFPIVFSKAPLLRVLKVGIVW